MTDPYREATRHDRKGLSTLARVFLIAGGLLLAVVVALGIWLSVAVDRMADEWNDPWETQGAEAAREVAVVRRAAETAAEARRAAGELAEARRSIAEAQEPVAAELSRAVATVMKDMLEDEGLGLEPAESGIGLRFTPREGAVTSWSTDFASVSELLDKVARGESVLAGAERSGEPRRDRDDDGVAPDWVPVYPGAHSAFTLAATREDLSFGVAAFVAEGSGHGILDWYDGTAERMARSGTTFQHRVIRDEEAGRQDLRRDLGRYSIRWDGRLVTVFVLEDDHGDSLLLLLYKG